MSEDVKPPVPPKPDPEKEKLEREYALAKLRADIAKEEAARFAATLPTSETKVVERKTTVDDKFMIEAEILAYRELRKVAGRIAEKVKDKPASKAPLLIHHEPDHVARAAWLAWKKQVEQLTKAYEAIATTIQAREILSTVLMATAAVKSVIDLVMLFRNDVEVKGLTFDIADIALIAEISSVMAPEREVRITQLVPPETNAAAIDDALTALRAAAAAAKDRANDPADVNRLAQLDATRQTLEDLIMRVAADGTSPAAVLMRGAAIETWLAERDHAGILYLKILRAGGANIATNGYFGATNLKHSGGVIVAYILMDKAGKILLSGTENSYSGAVESVTTTG